MLAAVLCGVWLAYGERAAFQLGRAVAVRLFSPLVLLLANAIVSRGPPRAAVVLPA
ncbi:hypothetical protein K7472_05130 [Streptomyces sp. PTM05]|uniref:EamA family transporter n=1 Tax=Streptantibioticus parmotrematis TaxID=2873249 RepID=A0ABS7QM12_9ACTN|nr:hypothetical protein [Streptantibioticus parmotrematis]MBY8884229.1 hypothetical protein [Streptantibioticus parmotrematis]